MEYDQLPEGRFEFIPFWGFLAFCFTPCGVSIADAAKRWSSRRFSGDGKRTLTRAYMLFLARWARKLSGKETAESFRTSSRIEPMQKIAHSMRQHRELILNCFRAQKLFSSGVVEGLNKKAKLTVRKSYGFRAFGCLELALYHSLGKLPEPESTHDVF